MKYGIFQGKLGISRNPPEFSSVSSAFMSIDAATFCTSPRPLTKLPLDSLPRLRGIYLVHQKHTVTWIQPILISANFDPTNPTSYRTNVDMVRPIEDIDRLPAVIQNQ